MSVEDDAEVWNYYYYYYYLFNDALSGTTRVNRYQKVKTNLDLLEQETGRMPFLPPNQQRQSTEGIRGLELW